MSKKPVVIAIDGWFIWARDEQGDVLRACSQMWSEWLDTDKPPEEMETTEFRKAALQILRTKANVSWRTQREVWPYDSADDSAYHADEIEGLARAQAEFIAANR